MDKSFCMYSAFMGCAVSFGYRQFNILWRTMYIHIWVVFRIKWVSRIWGEREGAVYTDGRPSDSYLVCAIALIPLIHPFFISFFFPLLRMRHLHASNLPVTFLPFLPCPSVPSPSSSSLSFVFVSLSNVFSLFSRFRGFIRHREAPPRHTHIKHDRTGNQHNAGGHPHSGGKWVSRCRCIKCQSLKGEDHPYVEYRTTRGRSGRTHIFPTQEKFWLTVNGDDVSAPQLNF